MKREVVVVECEMDRQPGIPDPVATRSDDVALVVFDSAAPPPPPIPPSGDKGTLKLAYKTLGVVFGGLVTSLLYVYPSMRLKSPIEDDYLGIYSIMFWTLSLIGVIKYACIALRADDHGEALKSMCMLIGDGILAPAISVLSVMNGIRAPFPSVSKSLVEVLSAVVLIVLFLLQKYGTSRAGSEALFADLGHFNQKSIQQLAFLFTTYPSLVLTYAGQTAYLIKNPNDHDDGFYKSIPKTIYWPMFIVATLAAIVASQSLISATFSIIKQSATLDYFPLVKVVHTSSKKEGEVYCPKINYILMILCVAVILIFGDGKDIGNAFGYDSHKIDRDRLRMLLSDPKVHRVPGVYFFYTNIQDGLTPILEHYIKNMKSLHKVTIFTTFRYLLVPRVAPHERIVVSKLGLKGAYRCVVQYSYADSLDLEGDDFVSQVIDRLRAHIQNGSDYATSVTFELEEEMSDTESSLAWFMFGERQGFIIACYGGAAIAAC
ncbi:unnamed protein product [Camellia sinensis]